MPCRCRATDDGCRPVTPSAPLGPTPLRWLGALTVVAAVAGATLADLWETFLGRLLPVPASPVGACLLIAAAVAGWAVMLRGRLSARRSWPTSGHPGQQVRRAVSPIPSARTPRPVPPLLAARSLALALAASRVGALVTGCYAGIAVVFLGMAALPAGRERLVTCAAAVVAGIALTASGLWLERILRVPPNAAEPAGEPG